MAMTNCKECGKAVSSEAAMCPSCGIGSPTLTQDQKTQLAKQGLFARSRAFAGILFFVGLAWLAFAAVVSPDTVVATFSSAKWLIGGGAFWYVLVEIDRNLAERKSR